MLTKLNNCSPGEEEHELMYNELVPAMQGILAEIRDDFLTPQEISNAELQAKFLTESSVNGLPYINWDWTQFYYYFSLQGLGNTKSFDEEITGIQDYNTHANIYFNSDYNE